MSGPPLVYINNAVGTRLAIPKDWISVEYARAENGIGAALLVLPGNNYDRPTFPKDGLVEIWRVPDSGSPYLDTETLWLIRRVVYKTGPPAVWEITAYDLNHILTRRIVDYNSNNAFSDKVMAADDMGKQVISENFGAGATDTTRSIAAYLSIQASSALAPSIRMDFSRQNVFKVLQDIADASYQNGTYLVFDVVCKTPPAFGAFPVLEFRSYVKYRGVDRTTTLSNQNQLLIGTDFGNLSEGVVDEDATNEITRGIALGQGIDSVQAVARTDDLARQAESPFGLIENARSASGALVAADLTAQSQAEVRSGIPKITVSGKFVSGTGLLYGLDWNWGDLVTAQVNGISQVCHVQGIKVHYGRDSGETVEPILSGAVA